MNCRVSRPGFTLLELLVVIAIIGMLMGVGVTTFGTFGKRAQIEGDARALRDKIILARTYSISKSRKFALRITQTTERKRWKAVIIDSGDNILDNGDPAERIVDNPFFLKARIELEQDTEIEFTPEGSISYSTSNPVYILDTSDKRELWKLPLVLYKAAGNAKLGELEKVPRTPGTGATNAAAAEAEAAAPEQAE
ncbi:type II secretion system protein [bacterium]|nr:type II secretion system protein [bacterium]